MRKRKENELPGPMNTEIKIDAGKLYLRTSDVWAINTLTPGYIQVYAKDQIFKVKDGELGLYGETTAKEEKE